MRCLALSGYVQSEIPELCISSAPIRETNPTKPKQERREGIISAKAATDKESSYGAEQMRVIT